MSESALRFSDVAKNYDRTPILRDVTFEVARGEFFGLVVTGDPEEKTGI